MADMNELFKTWVRLRDLMKANGLRANFLVILSSDDFDLHIAKATNRAELLRGEKIENIQWFRHQGIVFQRKPHHLDN